MVAIPVTAKKCPQCGADLKERGIHLTPWGEYYCYACEHRFMYIPILLDKETK